MFGLLPVMYFIAMTPKNLDGVFSLGNMISYIAVVLFGIVLFENLRQPQRCGVK